MILSTKIPGIFILLALSPAAHVIAQATFDLDEIKVVAPYEPTISDAHKINLNPRLDAAPDIQMVFNYVIPPRRLNTSFVLDPISPARMRGEPLAKLYRGLVKGGYGNYSTPYFEGFYNTLRSNEHALGLHLRHMSSGGGISHAGHSAYSDNLVRLNGQKFFENNTLDADLKYERNVLHYYGFNREDYPEGSPLLSHIDSLSNDDIRQGFNQLAANVGFGSHLADSSALRHHSGISYRYFADQYDASEHFASYAGQIGKNISADPFGMADKQYFQLNAIGDFYHSQNLVDTASTWLISLQPRLWSKYKAFEFYIGMNATVQVDTTSFFRAYPVLGAEFNIVENRFVAFISATGQTEKHTAYSLSRVNPFIFTSSPLAFMNVKSDIGGGVKGSLGGLLSFNFSINRAVIENHPFFVNDTTALLNNRFSVVYDNITRFHLRAELMSTFGERFSAKLTANYFQYGLNSEIEAWHTPTSLFTGHFKYNIQNKIILTANVYTRNETYGRLFDENKNPYAGIAHPFHADISAGIEYRYTKLLSVFLNFNNVNNKSVERWMNYPSQGFNFLGGLAISF